MRGGHLAILRSGFGATKEREVAAGDIVPVPGAQFEQTLASASPDMLREMIREFAQRMMDADVEVACNAGYGEVTPDRVNSRNGYRRREWDTRAGTIELAIPKLRAGSYFPGFLEHRRRAERALASVVATSYLLGVSTRRVEKLAASLGVVGLSKSQVSVMAGELDELVDGCRNRPSRGCRPWSGPSSSSLTRPRSAPSTPRSCKPWRPSCRLRPPTWMTPARTSWRSPRSRARCGGRSGATTRRSG